jgi:hypothetical protein
MSVIPIGSSHRSTCSHKHAFFLESPELLIDQIKGLSQAQAKNEELKQLHTRAEELIAKIGAVEVQCIPRLMNREAYALANKVIDEKIK